MTEFHANNNSILLNELDNHIELKFLRLCRALEEAALICENEYWELMEGALEIFEEKHLKLKQENPQADKDSFFEEILGRLALNHESNYRSISWAIEQHEIFESLLRNTCDKKTQKATLQNILESEARPTTWGEKLLYLAVGINFYKELGRNTVFLLSEDLPSILKLDRTLSYVLEDIAAALATTHKSTENAIALTKTQVQNDINRLKNNEEFLKVVMTLQNAHHGEKMKLNAFAKLIFKEMEEPPDMKTITNRLKRFGTIPSNFQGKLDKKEILGKQQKI